MGEHGLGQGVGEHEKLALLVVPKHCDVKLVVKLHVVK